MLATVLLIAAARLAKVDRLVIHSLRPEGTAAFRAAEKALSELLYGIESVSFAVRDFEARLETMNFKPAS